MLGLFDLLFGCHHKKKSFPMSRKRGQRASAAASVTGTYVVCLNCGKEFPYDWQGMKVVDAPSKHTERVAQEAAESFAGE